jgi:hypothetical protein
VTVNGEEFDNVDEMTYLVGLHVPETRMRAIQILRFLAVCTAKFISPDFQSPE